MVGAQHRQYDQHLPKRSAYLLCEEYRKATLEKKKAAPKERQKTVTSNEREKP